MTERELSDDAYRLAAEPKEPLIVPGAGHVDLYDHANLIPFDKPAGFFTRHLKQDFISRIGPNFPQRKPP